MTRNYNEFVHLHVHTEYSPLDGLNKIGPLVERIKNLGMSACAITDHGNLHGALEFYKTCKKAAIKPILGSEVYCTMNPDGLSNENKVRDNRHLILLAMNEEGWNNLIWLNNQAHLNNFYYNPRVYIHHLKDHSAGLIATTACLGGVLARRRILEGENITQEGAVYSETDGFSDPSGTNLKWLLILKEYFQGRLYIELQDQPNWEQNVFNKWAQGVAKEHNIPTTLACDAHYLRQEDEASHNLLMAQQYGLSLVEYQEKRQFKIKNWVREPDELYKAAAISGLEDAFWNTATIAEQCNVEIQLGKYQTPEFDITKCSDYQEFLAWQGQYST